MAKVKYTYAEALLKVSELTPDEAEIMELLKNARTRVLEKPDVAYMRRTVAAEAGCRTAHAVTFLPLIDAMGLTIRRSLVQALGAMLPDCRTTAFSTSMLRCNGEPIHLRP
jgi:hypothetical protein